MAMRWHSCHRYQAAESAARSPADCGVQPAAMFGQAAGPQAVGRLLMLDKLASVEAQYNYLMGLIADPAVQADAQAYRTHTKTLSDLQEMVDAYRALKSLEEQLAQARELAHGNDAEMAALAKEELADLEPRH